MAATKLLEREQLRVCQRPPADAVNAKIQETFVASARTTPPLGTSGAGGQSPESLKTALRAKVFAGWPSETNALAVQIKESREQHGVRMEAYVFQSQPQVELWMHVFTRAKGRKPDAVKLLVLAEADWKECQATFGPWLGGSEPSPPPTLESARSGGSRWNDLRREVEAGKLTLALFAPRGIGPTAWTGDEKKQTLIRRRFMLLGQTLDGMRVWDIRRAVQALNSIDQNRARPLVVAATGRMGVNALYAAMFEPGIRRLELKKLPGSHAEGPDYLNVLQVLDIPRALPLAADRTELDLQ